MSAQAAPFALLTDIAKRSRALALGLPEQEEAIELWNGIAFSMAGDRYVAPMGEVVEILHLPRYTQIPGVKSFLLGAANVRGRLLPLIDLAQFFELPRKVRTARDRRVLVVEQGDVFSGLVVDEVLGMQYFNVDSYHPQIANTQQQVAPFVQGGFIRSEAAWQIFSMVTLMENPRFLDVSST